MASVIRNRQVVADNWLQLDAKRWLLVGEDGLVPDFPMDADLLVPLELWRLRGEDLTARRGRLGLIVEGWDEPKSFADALPHLRLVAIHIPLFTDGRAYSLARLLRERHGYTGELRAIGDVLRDQLYYLSRCGFDAFALKDPSGSAEAVASLGDFSEAYQASAERPQPHVRTRLAAGASGLR